MPTPILLKRACPVLFPDCHYAQKCFKLLKAARMGRFVEFEDDRVASAADPGGAVLGDEEATAVPLIGEILPLRGSSAILRPTHSSPTQVGPRASSIGFLATDADSGTCRVRPVVGEFVHNQAKDGSTMASPWGQDTLLRRIIRAQSRFRIIARSDGVAVALIKCAARSARSSPTAAGPGRVDRYGCPSPLCTAAETGPLDAWRRVNRDNPRRRRLIEAALKPPAEKRRFSVIVPVYNPPIDVLRTMIGSVLDQTVADWELVLVDDASPDAHVRSEMTTGRAGTGASA